MQDRQDVDRAARTRSTSGSGMPSCAEQRAEVRPTSRRDLARAEGQLEDQVPADDPGDELAEGRVGERVGRARHRHGRGELGVAERRQRADDAGDDEDDRDRGAGLVAAAPR